MYVNDMDPYEEAQNIIEVWERGNPVKMQHSSGFTQIEQTNKADAEIVVEELERRGFIVKHFQENPAGGFKCTIQRARGDEER